MIGETLGPRAILLFGATGQIGHALAPCLEPLGAVVAPQRDRVDLADAPSLVRFIRDTAPSLIINAAAYTDVDGAEQEPETAVAVNATAPGIMAEEAKRLGAPLVHYSTDYVFDGLPADGAASERRPYRETDRPAPLNLYGNSKLDGEKAIRTVAPTHLILRTSWVYSDRGRNFFLTIRRLAATQDELRIVNDQTGSPTFAQSIAKATVSILRKSHTNSRASNGPDISEASGCYHLSAAGETTWYDFARSIVSATDTVDGSAPPRVSGITTSDYPLPARRPAYSVLDNSLLQATFGITMP